MKTTQPTVIELFAGIAGFGLGFELAGFRIVAHVEKDAHCRKLLHSKWPDAISLDDVCTAGAHNLPPADVLTFGFPCQDLSVAGKRAGLVGGARSSLFMEALRIADELNIPWILFENVPGLLSGKEEDADEATEGSDNDADSGERDGLAAFRGGPVPPSWMGVLLAEVGKRGYSGCWRVLDAQWLGVAQRRRRVFGLFTRLDSGARRCAEVLSIAESLRGHPPPRRETREGTAPGTAAGPAAGGSVTGTLDRKTCSSNRGAQANETDFLIPHVASTLRSASDSPADHGKANGTDRTTLIPEVAACLVQRDAKGADSDTKPGHLVPVAFTHSGYSNKPAWITGDRTDCLTAGGNHDSSNQGIGIMQPCAFKPSHYTRGKDGAPSEVVAPLSADADKGDQESVVAQVQWASGGGQMHNPTAQALRSGAEHNYQFAQIGMQVRRLTPTECERLQGFPDDHTAGFSDSTRYKMLGNAVCRTVSEWIAKRLHAHIHSTPSKEIAPPKGS